MGPLRALAFLLLFSVLGLRQAKSDRQDANDFFAEIEEISASIPSGSQEADKKYGKTRDFTKKVAPSSNERRFSKTGLHPKLQTKPNSQEYDANAPEYSDSRDSTEKTSTEASDRIRPRLRQLLRPSSTQSSASLEYREQNSVQEEENRLKDRSDSEEKGEPRPRTEEQKENDEPWMPIVGPAPTAKMSTESYSKEEDQKPQSARSEFRRGPRLKSTIPPFHRASDEYSQEVLLPGQPQYSNRNSLDHSLESLTRENDRRRIRFKDSRKNNLEEVFPLSEESFLIDEDGYPVVKEDAQGHGKARSKLPPISKEIFPEKKGAGKKLYRKVNKRPLVKHRRPEYIDEETPTQLTKINMDNEEERPVFIVKPRSGNSNQIAKGTDAQTTPSPREGDTFLTEEGTLPPKVESYSYAGDLPPSSRENSVNEGDDFLREPRPSHRSRSRIRSRVSSSPKHLGRVRWPPPKSTDSDESSRNHPRFNQPLFYADMKDVKPPSTQRSPEANSDKAQVQDRQYNSYQDSRGQTPEPGVDEKNRDKDEGRPPYVEYHPIAELEKENSHEEHIIVAHGSTRGPPPGVTVVRQGSGEDHYPREDDRDYDEGVHRGRGSGEEHEEQSHESEEEHPPTHHSSSEAPPPEDYPEATSEESPYRGSGEEDRGPSSRESAEVVEDIPQDFDERPPDYDSGRPTPEYEDHGTGQRGPQHSGEDGGPVQGSPAGPGSVEEDYEEGPTPDDYSERPPPPGDYEEQRAPEDYEQVSSEAPVRDSSPSPTPYSSPPSQAPVPAPRPHPHHPDHMHSAESHEEDTSHENHLHRDHESHEDGGDSHEFNFGSFEFPFDPLTSTENEGTLRPPTTRRPLVTVRPSSLPAECPNGDEDDPGRPPVDLSRAKPPLSSPQPEWRPGDEVPFQIQKRNISSRLAKAPQGQGSGGHPRHRRTGTPSCPRSVGESRGRIAERYENYRPKVSITTGRVDADRHPTQRPRQQTRGRLSTVRPRQNDSGRSTQRPVAINALGVVKPSGQIISRVVTPTAGPTARAQLEPPRRASSSFGRRRSPTVQEEATGPSSSSRPTEDWKAVLEAREATALTYLKPPPVGEPVAWPSTTKKPFQIHIPEAT